MDPNAALDGILRGEFELWPGLQEWLERGGFAPEVTGVPEGAHARFAGWPTESGEVTLTASVWGIGAMVDPGEDGVFISAAELHGLAEVAS